MNHRFEWVARRIAVARLMTLVVLVPLIMTNCSSPLDTPVAGASKPSGLYDADAIRLGPRATVPATLTSNVSITSFKISGVGAREDIILPATNVAKVMLPVGEITIEAAVRCYPAIVNHAQIGRRDNNIDIDFVFSNANRRPKCEDDVTDPTIVQMSAQPRPGESDKLAWVVTNSSYKNGWPALDFVESDKTNVTALLRHAGFQVTNSYNLTYQELLSAEAAFSRALTNSAWRAVIIYFSGHGMGLQGQNYFVPVDAPAADRIFASDLYPIARSQQILRSLVAGGTFGIVLVDACRAGTGKSTMVVPDNQEVLINYSTSPGGTSYDSLNHMSGWTERFVAVSGSYPGLGIDQLVMYADRYTKWQSAASLRFQTPVLYGRFPAHVPPLGWQKADLDGSEIAPLTQAVQ